MEVPRKRGDAGAALVTKQVGELSKAGGSPGRRRGEPQEHEDGWPGPSALTLFGRNQ